MSSSLECTSSTASEVLPMTTLYTECGAKGNLRNSRSVNSGARTLIPPEVLAAASQSALTGGNTHTHQHEQAKARRRINSAGPIGALMPESKLLNLLPTKARNLILPYGAVVDLV